MTKPAHNPPRVNEPVTSGGAMHIARIAIAIGLCVGIAVFAVLTVGQLDAGPPRAALPTNFATSDSAPTESAASPDASSLASLARTDPTKFIPIVRSNPNPGRFVPFMRADPYGQPPYQQAAAGEVWEFAAYRLTDASLIDLIAHYEKQATGVGMKRIKQQPTSENMPGGVAVAWSDGRRGLRVTAWPTPNNPPPAQPPMRPDTPLQWVVKYSYPTTTR